MSRRFLRIALLTFLAGLLAACGTKGALVMPDQQATSKKKQTKAKPLPPPVSIPSTPAPAQPAPVQPATASPTSGDGSGPGQ
jgi:predicted small lipoprotein YifL